MQSYLTRNLPINFCCLNLAFLQSFYPHLCFVSLLYGFLQVSILADCVGALLAYGALCSQGVSNADGVSVDSLHVNYTGDNQSDAASVAELHPDRLSVRGRSLSADSSHLSQFSLIRSQKQFDFDVTNLFCCGSPIGMILMKQFFESNGGAFLILLYHFYFHNFHAHLS